MIGAAVVRAQISQIEKYNSAANTFYGKYGYLPGDLPAAPASLFGFAARGQYAGEGDGNGVLEGISSDTPGSHQGAKLGAGETAMFWVDLSTANLIDNTFTSASETSLGGAPDATGASISAYMPRAKIGGGNFMYVWSGGMFNGTSLNNSQNYFGLSAVTLLALASNNGFTSSNPGLSVMQAYSIDKKIDDGLPLSGRVTMYYLNYGSYNESPGGVVSPSSTTCADNGGGGPSVIPYYSIEVNNGNGVNCALSFRMQAGD